MQYILYNTYLKDKTDHITLSTTVLDLKKEMCRIIMIFISLKKWKQKTKSLIESSDLLQRGFPFQYQNEQLSNVIFLRIISILFKAAFMTIRNLNISRYEPEAH